MNNKSRTLVVVGNKKEAKEAFKIAGLEADYIATNLEAEFYLEKVIPGYKNPVYDLINKNESRESKKYIFDNFDIAYKFCGDDALKYIRVRFGYFLAELERSLDLAHYAVHKFNPEFLIIGALKNYPGSSVVDGTLKTNAFFLLAKEMKIPYRLIGTNNNSFSFKQSIGRKIQLLRYLNKQKIQYGSDLLILATPRHLIQMAPVISEIKRRGINITILTYNVTLALKKDLDKNFTVYLEKERLIDSSVSYDVKKIQKKLGSEKPWREYSSKKYKSKSEVLNYIRQKIEDIIKNETSEIFSDILLAEKVLSGLRPKALLTTTDPDSKILPYIDKAKESGIKTICIQHGAFYGKDSPAVVPASDFFIAWSEISKNWLKRSDYFKHLKILIGNSPFHQYPEIPKKIPSTGQLTILYLATKQPTVDKGLVMFYLRKLFETLSKIGSQFELIIRVHPFQDASNFKSLAEIFERKVSFENEESLREVIKRADIVFYENTTAGFDAMLSGKPTVYFNPYSGEDFYNVKKHKASLTILDDEDLENKLPDFLLEKKRREHYSKKGKEFAKDYLGLRNPASNLAETVVKLTRA